jgi:hypothetical protein
MDQLAARAAVVPASDVGDGLATSIARSEITAVLDQNESPIELVLELTQFSDGKATDTRSVAVSWERTELMELLRDVQGEDVQLTFDRQALQQAVESQVEAHGLREAVLALAVAASAATGAAGTASAEPGAFFGSGTPVVQTGPDDRAVPRGAPVAAPELAPDDRAVPRSTPAPVLTSVPVASPDDRAFPRSTPAAAPIAGTASDPGISWGARGTETAVIAGAIALVITGAFFVVGRRRVRPGPA